MFEGNKESSSKLPSLLPPRKSLWEKSKKLTSVSNNWEAKSKNGNSDSRLRAKLSTSIMFTSDYMVILTHGFGDSSSRKVVILTHSRLVIHRKETQIVTGSGDSDSRLENKGII